MKIGIALSGGAVRGLAHIGVLKALEELDIKPDIVSGVSAGSIIGSFYCAGYSPKEMEEIALKTNLNSFILPSISKKALFSLDKLESFLEKYIGKINIEDLKIPLIIAATNLNKATIEYFQSGSLIKTVKASCSIPVMFKPVKIDKYFYVDGGVMNNLPVEPLREKVDFAIGVEVNPFLEEEKDFNN
ncbi:MAG: patatin-like phospholipase family protein, partial [Sulfurihydrogenibium sp.]|nr:patatin-like phospholipase family protein [Sulfurihydrogenibium sp.]